MATHFCTLNCEGSHGGCATANFFSLYYCFHTAKFLLKEIDGVHDISLSAKVLKGKAVKRGGFCLEK